MSIHTQNAARRAIIARLQNSDTLGRLELMHHTKPVDTKGIPIPGKWSLYSNLIKKVLDALEQEKLVQYTSGDIPGKAYGDYTLTPAGKAVALDSIEVDETYLPPHKGNKPNPNRRITIADAQTAVTQILGAKNPQVASIMALLERNREGKGAQL